MIRVGAVSYLNTKPLIYGLRERLPNIDLQFDLPSRLSDRLSDKSLDIALIPSVEFLRSPGSIILSDACIACRGPVRSVRILFRRPPGEIETLALDEGSRTSAALAQVLLRKQFDVAPKLLPLNIDADLDTVPGDALLVIGDRAMEIDESSFVESWDLGQRWFELTGLPFVFAMWVACGPHGQSLEFQAIAAAFQASRDAGVAAMGELSEKYHNQYGISQADCLRYFANQLHFQLGDRELAGLSLFRDWAVQYGLLPSTSQQLSLVPT